MFRSFRLPLDIVVASRVLGPRAFLRMYATFSNEFTIDAHRVLELDLETLPRQSTIQLVTSRTWPKFRKGEIDSPAARDCAARLPGILAALHSAPMVYKTSISMDDILDLPIHVEKKQDCNSIIARLHKVGITAYCVDLGKWTLGDLSSIEITHYRTRLSLAKVRSVEDRASWHAFVSACKDPVYQAFDYTADFHSRDLDGKTNDHPWIDLGVMGSGRHRMVSTLDALSVDFAGDLDHNTTYFQNSNHQYKPDMYKSFREEGRSCISSKLADGDDDDTPTSLVLNIEVCLVPDNMMEKLLAMLKVGEDEEVVYEGKTIRKRKKGAE